MILFAEPFVQSPSFSAENDEHAVSFARQKSAQNIGRLRNASGADAAAGKQTAEALFRKPQPFSGFLLREGEGEFPVHRYAEGKKLFGRNAPAGKFRRKLRRRDDIIIADAFLQERNAGIVRGNLNGGWKGGSLLSQSRQDMRRIHMGHENHIEVILFQITLQMPGKQAVHLIDRRSDGEPAVMLTQGIGKTEQSWGILHHTDVAVAHQRGGFSAGKGKGVKKNSGMSPPFQFIGHRPRGGMMAAARAAGKNQCFHNAFTSHLSRISEPERSFAATAAVMIQKPAETGVSGKNTTMRTAETR